MTNSLTRTGRLRQREWKVRLTLPLHAEIADRAKRHGCTVNAWIVRAIWAQIEKESE